MLIILPHSFTHILNWGLGRPNNIIFYNSYSLDHYLLEYSSDLITILLKDSLSSIKFLHVVCTAECSNYLGCGLYTLVPLSIINSFKKQQFRETNQYVYNLVP